VRRYVSYYHKARTHLALGKDAPEARTVQPPEEGGCQKSEVFTTGKRGARRRVRRFYAGCDP
jgi:hypothetical protein